MLFGFMVLELSGRNVTDIFFSRRRKVCRLYVKRRIFSYIGGLSWNMFYSILSINYGGWIRHGNKTRAHGYPPKSTPIWRVFSDLTEFGYRFGFSPISKYGYGTGNGDICTHPEPIPKPYPNVERSCFCVCWGGW